MKKLLLITLLFTATVNAQTFTVPESVVAKSKPVAEARYAESISSAPVALRNFALQLTFTQLAREGDHWKAGNLFTLGESFLWSWGGGQFNNDGSVTVESRLSLGFGFNFGLSPVPETGILVGSLPCGGIIQYSTYGLFGGYDILNEKPIIGISYKLPGTFLSGLTRFSKLPN